MNNGVVRIQPSQSENSTSNFPAFDWMFICLSGLDGVIVYFDDILVMGSDDYKLWQNSAPGPRTFTSFGISRESREMQILRSWSENNLQTVPTRIDAQSSSPEGSEGCLCLFQTCKLIWEFCSASTSSQGIVGMSTAEECSVQLHV